MYCGETDEPLFTEHAVPYGLNGEWTLLRASCPKCAKITSAFERQALRGLLPAIRNALNMRTRRKKSRSQTLPIVVERGAEQQTIEVAPNEFPLYLPTPVFPPPGIVIARPPTVWAQSYLSFIHLAGPSFEDFSKQYPGATFVGVRVTYAPEEFALLLAKVAYCFGVYALGLGPLRDSPIRDVILGKDPFVGHWVGAWTGEAQNPCEGLHSARLTATTNGDDLHVALRLFAQFGAPEYHIALGRVKPEFVNSPDWRFKPMEPRSMPNESCDVGLITEGRALAPLSQQVREDFERLGLEVVTDHRDETSIRASIEWLMPTAVVLWLTNKYLGTLLQEGPKDHYPKLRDALLRVVRRTTGPDKELKLTILTSGPSKVPDVDAVAFSIWLPRGPERGAVMFRFDQDLSRDDLSAAVDAFVTLALAHAEKGILAEEPSFLPASRIPSTVMKFDAASARWRAWTLDPKTGQASPAKSD
jgi:hypothetical protein